MKTIELKPKILLYEGIPGSGKSTLQRAVSKYRNHQHLSLDRFTPSMWVYAKYRGDSTYLLNERVENLLEENFDVYVIWCLCNIGLAYNRCVRKADWADANIDMLQQLEILYKTYFSTVSTYTKIIKINTEEEVHKCVLNVVEKVWSL